MTEEWILSFGLILVRLATFWMFNPVWSTLKPPRLVKLGLVLAFAVFWFSRLEHPVTALTETSSQAGYWSLLILLVAREIALGGILGFSFHIFFVPMQIAGAYIGQELGLSLATMTDPASGAINNIVATLFQAVAVCLFFLLDLHYYIVYLLEYSFQFIPAGETWNLQAISVATMEFAELTANGILICMPVAVVMFLTLIALLVLARAVPALNLFSIGLSVRLLLGIGAMLVFLPHILSAFNIQLDAGLFSLEQLLAGLSGNQ